MARTKTSITSEQLLWDVPNWSHACNVSVSTTRDMIRKGEIPSVKIRGSRKISLRPEGYLQNLLAEQKSEL